MREMYSRIYFNRMIADEVIKYSSIIRASYHLAYIEVYPSNYQLDKTAAYQAILDAELPFYIYQYEDTNEIGVLCNFHNVCQIEDSNKWQELIYYKFNEKENMKYKELELYKIV